VRALMHDIAAYVWRLVRFLTCSVIHHFTDPAHVNVFRAGEWCDAGLDSDHEGVKLDCRSLLTSVVQSHHD
jgi:hypothetical protein